MYAVNGVLRRTDGQFAMDSSAAVVETRGISGGARLCCPESKESTLWNPLNRKTLTFPGSVLYILEANCARNTEHNQMVFGNISTNMTF